MLVRLGSPSVPHHIVIAAATVAFKKCGYSKELLGKAAMEWEEITAASPLNLDLDTTFPLFEAHWNLALNLIHQHSDFPKGKANNAKDVTLLVQTAVASALAAQSSITDNFNDVILTEQMSMSRQLDELQSNSGIPSVIGTTTSSALSTLKQSQGTAVELQQ